MLGLDANFVLYNNRCVSTYTMTTTSMKGVPAYLNECNTKTNKVRTGKKKVILCSETPFYITVDLVGQALGKCIRQEFVFARCNFTNDNGTSKVIT